MSNELVNTVVAKLNSIDIEANRIKTGNEALRQALKEYFNIEVPAGTKIDQMADYVKSRHVLPGPKDLSIGTMELGYFGIVPASQMGTFVGGAKNGQRVTATNLAAQVGITSGTAQNEAFNFHKFAYKREIIYVAEKTIRYSTPWIDIAQANCVFGQEVIQIGQAKYKMTLLGGLNNEFDGYSKVDQSEWDKLWGIVNLTPSQLGLSGNGSWSWCKETVDTTDNGYKGVRRSLRGGSSVSGVGNYRASTAHTPNGWRPALRFTL